MTTFKDALRSAKLPERVVPICLALDLQTKFEAAERELQAAIRAGRDSLADAGPTALAERVEQLRQQMQGSTFDVRLRALTRPAWRALMGEHQPRKADDGSVDERDKYVGVNVDTFFAALVRACLVDPELDDEDWQLLVDEKLTDAQFDQLADAAWSLNRKDTDVPFSFAASKLTRTSSLE